MRETTEKSYDKTPFVESDREDLRLPGRKNKSENAQFAEKHGGFFASGAKIGGFFIRRPLAATFFALIPAPHQPPSIRYNRCIRLDPHDKGFKMKYSFGLRAKGAVMLGLAKAGPRG